MRRRAAVNGSRHAPHVAGFLQNLVERFLEGALGTVQESVRDTAEAVRARLVTGLVGSGILIAAAVILLTGGLRALRSAPLPPGIPEAIVGVLGLAAAWALLRRPPPRD